MSKLFEVFRDNPDLVAELDPIGHALRAYADSEAAGSFGDKMAAVCRELGERTEALDLVRPPGERTEALDLVRPPVEPPRGFNLDDLSPSAN